MGRVLYGRMPGVHLNEEGCRQARALGEALKARYKLDALISSPLDRARETARAIAAPQGLDVRIDEDLNELDFGDWMGKTFEELQQCEQWRRFNELRSLLPARGGETLLEAQARAWKSLERIEAGYGGGTVAVVTHGDIIRSLLMLLLGMPLDAVLRMEIEPASVSEVVLDGGAPLVRSMNERIWMGGKCP